MKKILHISTECYPAAKAGGMGDVVGALPIYSTNKEFSASVIIPKYKTAWIEDQVWKPQYKGSIKVGKVEYKYKIVRLKAKVLPYNLYAVDIPDLLDRASIYLNDEGNGYEDENERYIMFQRVICEWILSKDKTWDLLHCHDHMTGLIPFMLKCTDRYRSLSELPTLFTIHNGQYQGAMSWEHRSFLPEFHESYQGLLEWNGQINPLAAAIKCAWRVNTVSPSYMEELKNDFGNLTPLIQQEKDKCIGILNGIDPQIWDPKTDPMLKHQLLDSINSYKKSNKEALCKKLGIYKTKMLVSFIGRLAYEKGADLLAATIDMALEETKDIAFVILGSGDADTAEALESLDKKHNKYVKSIIAYDEKLAHEIYAASDFLMMPSRFEPCGLNQLYAMRYVTIPIARYTGGLKDTVPDISVGGNGISFDVAEDYDFLNAIERALKLYKNKKDFYKLQYKISALDFSWQQSAQNYIHQYSLLINS